MYRETFSIPSSTEVPESKPGVSMKQRLRSRTVSLPLFLLRRSLLSSRSDHHGGYGFVLANISVIFLVRLYECPTKRDFDLASFLGERSCDSGESIWTISSQSCTIDLISEVLPTP